MEESMRFRAMVVLLALVCPAIVIVATAPPVQAATSLVECSPPTLNVDSKGPKITCTLTMPSTPNPRGIDPAAVNLVVFDAGTLLAKIPPTAPCDPCVSGHTSDGGVRVKFHFDRTAVSDWARIAMPLSGADRGSLCLPERRNEVLIAFEIADPAFPFVFQRVWDGCDIHVSGDR